MNLMQRMMSKSLVVAGFVILGFLRCVLKGLSEGSLWINEPRSRLSVQRYW